MSIYEVITEYLEENKTGTTATIISKEGSGPRNVGAKMFVGEDGKIYGTIGGGTLEFKVYKEALARMDESKPKILKVKMDSTNVNTKDMICGGNIDVFLEPVLKEYAELYKKIVDMEKNGENGILVTRFKDKFSKKIMECNRDLFDADVNETDKKKFQKGLKGSNLYATDKVVVESLNHSPILYIFGAGHVSQYIAKIAKMVGFYVFVIDDREEFANKKRFPDADELRVEKFKDVFDNLKFDGNEFVVIVTRGHHFDADVLKETLKRDTKYVGMIGSKRKVKMIFEHMKEIGFSKKDLSKVYSPIGLSINAETPEEIAVSIMAEIIMTKRN